MDGKDDDSCSSGDSAVAFAYLDFEGVDFNSDGDDEKHADADEVRNKDDTHFNVSSDLVDKEKKKETKDSEKEQNPAVITSKDYNEKENLNKILLDSCQSLSLNKATNSNNHEPSPKELAKVNNTISYERVATTASLLDHEDKLALAQERLVLLNDCTIAKSDEKSKSSVNDFNLEISRVQMMSEKLANGQYIDVLSGTTAQELFQITEVIEDFPETAKTTVSQRIRDMVIGYCNNTAKCVEVEIIAIAALNLFMQVNYTGPSLHHGGVARPGKEDPVKEMKTINPHKIFVSHLKVTPDEALKASSKQNGDAKENDNENNENELPVDIPFRNAVLSELSVDGEWPCPVCKYPYFLLLARSILLTLADPNRPDWSHYVTIDNNKVLVQCDASSNQIIHYSPPPKAFVANALNLTSAQLWSGRAAVAHVRLLQADDPSSLNLWQEVKCMFESCKARFCHINNGSEEKDPSLKESRQLASKVLLEYGLAEHHFDYNKKGKTLFKEALVYADLDVQVTGAEGKRTKYQQKSTAQMLVRAKPASEVVLEKDIDRAEKISKQLIDHQDETILLDKVKYVEEDDNIHHELSILQQTILLALCLDVKNDNPMDGLTAEEMGAFLERVLQQHDDWMVYATGLLERAWLESERNHTRERAILQIQALADQHTNRLTLTQSTFQAAVEDSAPPQDRLRYIHYIVYPPRWAALRDLATRYAKMGIVTSAAEIFEEIELWDEVVECYRRAGKENKAEQVVRTRLQVAETPRMWAALGDITKDPSHYERALEVSNGKFSTAYVALGKHYSDKGDLVKAADYFKKAVSVKPLSPFVWFRLGTLSMRLKDWSTAMHAFSEVVQQEPEEGDAWANVAAIHMQNRNPAEAYPALNESLKINRNNWRVWFSKLYTCMDLKKYDEAIQACQILIDFKLKRNEAEGIPCIDEKVVRGIVGGTIAKYKKAIDDKDNIPEFDASKRSISRVRDLLSKLTSSMKSEAWLFEVSAFFHESVGCDDLALDDLMKEYRALHSIRSWETDNVALPKLCGVISQMTDLHTKDSTPDKLRKFKFLVNGVIKRIKAAYFDITKLPTRELDQLEKIINQLDDKVN
mmetsp:Transcript_28009/g.34579  ORF Transcript_28009/g.34579 Transcript_28009/m.34579 type:complete len:1093 (+) Transcript_28009:103-3381(+)